MNTKQQKQVQRAKARGEHHICGDMTAISEKRRKQKTLMKEQNPNFNKAEN